jgi:uncharacterized protein (DUF433 family)
MTRLLGNGVYTFSDAAKYTGLQPERVREWFGQNHGAPVLRSDYVNATEQPLISFHDLIELFVAGQLRERGATLRTVRQAHAALSEKWNTRHPFCRRELGVHQGQVLYIDLSDDQKAEIYDVLTSQRAFPDVLLPFLDRLDYDEATDAVKRWNIAEGVELNPDFCFGKPVVSQSKKPTYLLAAAYEANGRNENAVARWYGVSTEDVQAAVNFEAALTA